MPARMARGDAGQVAGQQGTTIDRATWQAMSVDQRVAWIRQNRADVAAEATATAAR